MDQRLIAQQMLKKAKAGVRAFVMDQDGTVKGDDPRYNTANLIKLLQKIARAGRYPAIITSSGASALKSFSPMNDFYIKEKNMPATFIAVGGGNALYRFDHKGRSEIYNHGLSIDEVKAIIKIWENLYKSFEIKESDLQPKGIETFKKFGLTDWTGYIPGQYLRISKYYKGRCFTEPIKVTVIFPVWSAEKQRDLVVLMQSALDKALGKGRYLASRGDDTFFHIIHTSKVDPKLLALQTIMKKLNLNKEQMVAFGDLPLDNDKELLKSLPYSFTNSNYDKKNLRSPPFILPGCLKSPVECVHQAIDYLLS